MDDEQPPPGPEPEASLAPAEPAASPPPPPRARRRLRAAVALTLVAAIALLAALQVSGLVRIIGGSSSASTPPLPARIAVVDAAGVLTTMDDHGGSSLRHPVDGVKLQFPAWSPDGSRVAAIGTGTGGGGVYVFQAREGGADPATATDPTVVYRSPDSLPFYLYWTPDGRNVTFLTQEPTELSFRVAPADGNSAGAIVRHGSPLYWDWVDPSRALVHVGGGTDAFLGEVGLDGAAGQPNATTPGVFRSPAVSRDSSHRAFMIDTGGGSGSIVIEGRDGGNRHEIPVPGLAAFTFAPAGTSLAFTAPAAANIQPPDLPIGPLRIVDVATGSVRTVQEGSLVAFFWSPDGKTIATLRIPAPGENDVALASATVPAADTPGYDLSVAFVDVATGEARAPKKIRITPLFALQILPFFDQYALSHRFWSPDSASILLPLVNDAGVDGVVVLPKDGSAERRLADGEMGFWSP